MLMGLYHTGMILTRLKGKEQRPSVPEKHHRSFMRYYMTVFAPCQPQNLQISSFQRVTHTVFATSPFLSCKLPQQNAGPKNKRLSFSDLQELKIKYFSGGMYVGKITFCFASVRPFGACAQQNSRKALAKGPQTFREGFPHVSPSKKGKALF